MKIYPNLRVIVTGILTGVCLSLSTLHAANEVYNKWTGTMEPVTPSGNTYTVSNAAQLAWVALNNTSNNGYAGKTIVLTANIDLDETNRLLVWTPIGSSAVPFAGTFDGQNHLIRGLRSFDSEDGVGLFGHVGASGIIRNVGISGGKMIANDQHRTGALAGVCAGSVSNCWSMAEIAMAGLVTGGLIGELTATGSLTDAYCCALIHNTGDTTGVLVGRNRGHITRAYTTGYAKNGYAFVGANHGGTYSNCFYDRKLYFQAPGVVTTGVKAMDETEKMFTCMGNHANWQNVSKKYPQLKSFSTTDASLLSVTPVFIDTTDHLIVNHANDLTMAFTVDTVGGVTWETQDIIGQEWLQFDKNSVTVVRPCSETDVLANATLRDERKTVYFRPRRLEDLTPGLFAGRRSVPAILCYDGDFKLGDSTRFVPATNGWGDKYYMIVRYGYNSDGELYPIDTILKNRAEKLFTSWLATYPLDRDDLEPGNYVLRSFVHDGRCVPDWKPNEGQFEYTILPKFDPGSIPSGRDTLYMANGQATINLTASTPASGGSGSFSYQWKRGAMDAAPGENLNYTVKASDFTTIPAFFRLRRKAKDNSGCGDDFSEGIYEVVLFDEFKTGEINTDGDMTFCTVEEAKAHTITATPATGGSTKYEYQWYTQSGSTLTPIAGATGNDLALNILDLNAGTDYIFVRKVKDDTHFTELTLTANQQKIHIMPVLTAGAIENADRGHRCFYPAAAGSTKVTISINETTAATGESPLEYRWIRIDGSNETIVGTDASLSYDVIVDDIAGTHFTYVREVKHGDCDWQRSDGTITEDYDLRGAGSISRTVCVSQVPFVMHWYDTRGNEFTHTFNTNGETWNVTDEYHPAGCPADTTITVNVVERPAISTETEAKLCQENSVITLYFDQTIGGADIFRIDYSPDLAKYMGRTDTIGAVTTPGTIILRNVPAIGEGDCYMDVVVGVTGGAYTIDEGVCYSPTNRVKLTSSLGGYVHSKFDRVLYVDNNPKNGELEEVTKKLRFTAYQWYKNGVAMAGQTEQFYQENGNQLNGIYYVQLTDESGKTYRSCDIQMPQSDIATSAAPPAIYPVPADPGEPVTISCYGGTVEITSCTGETVASIPAAEESVTVSAPHIGGIYYVQIRFADGTMRTEKLIVK